MKDRRPWPAAASRPALHAHRRRRSSILRASSSDGKLRLRRHQRQRGGRVVQGLQDRLRARKFGGWAYAESPLIDGDVTRLHPRRRAPLTIVALETRPTGSTDLEGKPHRPVFPPAASEATPRPAIPPSSRPPFTAPRSMSSSFPAASSALMPRPASSSGITNTPPTALLTAPRRS